MVYSDKLVLRDINLLCGLFAFCSNNQSTAFHVFGRVDSLYTINIRSGSSLYLSAHCQASNNQTIDQTVHADYRHASNEIFDSKQQNGGIFNNEPAWTLGGGSFEQRYRRSARISILFWLLSIHARNLMAIWLALRWMGDFYRFEQLVGSKHWTIRSPQISSALAAERPTAPKKKITFIKIICILHIIIIIIIIICVQKHQMQLHIYNTQHPAMGMAGHNRAGKNGT